MMQHLRFTATSTVGVQFLADRPGVGDSVVYPKVKRSWVSDANKVKRSSIIDYFR